MFDSYSVSMPRSIDVHSRVVEQRAPTDESVRLLREMQEKISQDFINRAPIQLNNLNVEFFKAYGIFGHEYAFAVNINGRKKIYKYNDVFVTGDNLVEYLIKKFSEDLAAEMLMTLSDEAKRTILSTNRK